MVTLLLFGVKLSTSWTGYTVFSIPQRKVRWAFTTVYAFVPNFFDSFLVSWTFTDVVGIELSWGSTGDSAITLFGLGIVGVVGWAWSASLIDGIEDVGGGALNTIVFDFDESLWTAGLDFVVIPAWIGLWDGVLRVDRECE